MAVTRKHPTNQPPLCAAPAATTATGLLVQKAQAGDTHAFDLLVRRFQDRAVGYGAALLGDFFLAEDAAQEAFLEMYRLLPNLRVPDAFPAYLRLTLRKQCDRITRRKRPPNVPLDAAWNVAGRDNIAQTVETWETNALLRDTVRGLPEAERVVVVLFYIGGRSLQDTASFLDIPVSTVKNRLHSARCKLRERITTMQENTMEATLNRKRPSQNERFRGQIISRLTDTYRQQMRENARTADRSLLNAARAELQQALDAGDVPDKETLLAGARLLLWTNDFSGLPEIMDRFLQQPALSPSETFWAKWTRLRGLAVRQDAQAVVSGQRELMAWLHEPTNQTIRLSASEPFSPTRDATEAALSPDAIPVFALGITETGVCFHEAGLVDEWLAIVKTTLAAAPKTSANRLWRFYALRHAAHLSALYDLSDEADAFLEAITAISGEENDWQAPRWPIEALLLKLRRFAGQADRTFARPLAQAAANGLTAYLSRPDAKTGEAVNIVRTLTHNLAAPLTLSGDHNLALPLWEQLLVPLPSEWSYFWYAECVWSVTGNRARTLDLLRDAAAYRFDDALRDSFLREAVGFADVRTDPDFLAALRSPAPAGTEQVS